MSIISSSFMPRVVTAGVPTRMPLALLIGCGVEGDAVLVHGDAGVVERVSLAILPLRPFGRRSTSMRWLSVPPLTMR